MVLVAAAIVVALAVGGSGAGAQPERSAERPTLTPRSLDPLQLQGRGFQKRERVRVTVTPTSSGEALTKRVRAKRGGSFSVRFDGVQACNGFEGVAVGRRGSRASMQFSALICP
jgi:hypothetical protein